MPEKTVLSEDAIVDIVWRVSKTTERLGSIMASYGIVDVRTFYKIIGEAGYMIRHSLIKKPTRATYRKRYTVAELKEIQAMLEAGVDISTIAAYKGARTRDHFKAIVNRSGYKIQRLCLPTSPPIIKGEED